MTESPINPTSLARRGGTQQALQCLDGERPAGEEALIMLASQGLEHGELLLFLHPFGGDGDCLLYTSDAADEMSEV